MKNFILIYLNRYNSPQRERIIGFWTIILPTLLFMMFSMVFSSCSGIQTCHTYDGAKYTRPVQVYSKAGYTRIKQYRKFRLTY